MNTFSHSVPTPLPFLSQLTLGMSMFFQGLLDGLDLLRHSWQHPLFETVELVKTPPRSHLAQTHKDTTHSLRVEGNVCVCVCVTNTQHYIQQLSFHTHPDKNCTSLIWQSWIDIKHYSIAYFDCITVYASINDGAHTRFVAVIRYPWVYKDPLCSDTWTRNWDGKVVPHWGQKNKSKSSNLPGSQISRHSWRPTQIFPSGVPEPSPTLSCQYQPDLNTNKSLSNQSYSWSLVATVK